MNFFVGQQIRFDRDGTKSLTMNFDDEVHSVTEIDDVPADELDKAGHHQYVRLENGSRYSGYWLKPA